MIREAVPSDLEAVASLAARLWPAHAPEDLKPEIAELIAARDAAIFLLFDDDGSPTGFAQCQLRRDYVEGTGTSPVGYLEGIYVDETQRRRGCGRALLAACERWAAGCGCKLDNDESLAFHLSAGFSEANRVICFAKRLARP